MTHLYWLDSWLCRNTQTVGGKAANLSKLYAFAQKWRAPVPPGFCLTAAQTAPTLSPDVRATVAIAYARLGERCGLANPPVAVRSSAIDEDGQAASFAGQHESYLNCIGVENVLEAIEKCWASAFSERALAYRAKQGLPPTRGLAVLVQQLIPADVSAVVFSADPRTGQRENVVINATWGLGESLVSGTATPDLYVARKRDGALLSQQLGDKAHMTLLSVSGTHEAPVPHLLRQEFVLSRDQVTQLTQLARLLEAEMRRPVDVECAFWRGALYLLQCRPITTLATYGPRVVTRPLVVSV